VRMILPPLAARRAVDCELVEFFHSHRKPAFNRALSLLCRYYNVRRPRIEWYEYIDWGKTAGKTFEDGLIILVHPENWKRGRIHNSERQWVQMIYHEMAHYLFWTDAERKADMFMRRMVTGLRPSRVRIRQRGILSTRRASGRPRTATPRRRRERLAAVASPRRIRRRRARARVA